jgi:hypothetical protein
MKPSPVTALPGPFEFSGNQYARTGVGDEEISNFFLAGVDGL